MYSFNKIVNETFTSLSMSGKINLQIGNFTDDELEIIKNKFFEIYNKYGLGVCLKPSVHSLFHKIYGYDNTPGQYEDFKNNWLVYHEIEKARKERKKSKSK